jgi:hypothetical protein
MYFQVEIISEKGLKGVKQGYREEEARWQMSSATSTSCIG